MREKLTASFRVAATVAALLAACVASAQRTTFHPSVFVGGVYDSNVEYVGDEQTSDTAGRIALELPVESQWDNGSLRFNYRPSYVKHTEIVDLDRDEHELELGVSTNPGRRTGLSLFSNYSKSQVQGRVGFTEPEQIEDRDLFLTRRTDRESYGAGVRLDRTASLRWSWSASASWAERRHEPIGDGGDDPTGDFEVEDRRGYGGSFSFTRTLSRSHSVGLQYEHRRFELETSGDELSNLLGVTYDRTVNVRYSYGFTLGGYLTSGATVVAEDGSDERIGGQGEFHVARSFRDGSIAVQISHSPTAGGHLQGTSTNTDGGLYLNLRRVRWDWAGSIRYVRRDPNDVGTLTRETLGVGAGAERLLVDVLSLRADLAWADETAAAGEGDSRSNFSVSLGMVWYPTGRRAARARESS